MKPIALLLLTLLPLPALANPTEEAAEEPVEETADPAPDPTETPSAAYADYPSLAPLTAAQLVQHNAYTPTEDERSLGTEDLLGSTAFLSEAVIRLDPEVDSFLSLDYRNVDIRELIARIGKVEGRHVLYFGEPLRVTVYANVVTPMKALELTLAAADSDLTYLLDGDVIVVGPKNLVTNTFLYTEVVVQKRLHHLQAEELAALAEVQGIEYAYITPPEQEGGTTAISATPRHLAHLLLLVEALDLEQNFLTVDGRSELILEPLTLQYISGRQFLSLADKFGVRAGVVADYSDEHLVYLTGPETTITALRRTAAAFDIPAHADIGARGSSIQALPLLLENVAPAEMKQQIESCPIHFNVLDMGDGRKTVYALGGQVETVEAVELMQSLDEEGARLLVISSGSTTKSMTTLRDQIVKETSLKRAQFTVTANLGYGDALHYLCCIATEEELAEALPYVTLE
ncbi:MAG: hypothetical protein IJC43_01850 [Clostridia bacterium]|nr:hypothetical protein [Clostridia bacterium]